MPRQLLTAQAVNRTGTTVTFATVVAADGAKFAYDQTKNTVLRIKNATGGDLVLTVPQATTVDGVATTGKTNTIAATSGDEMMGPFGDDYKQPDGFVYINVAGDLSIAVLQIASS